MGSGAKGRRLSRSLRQKKATLNNRGTSLFMHGGIQTAEAKAKELRPVAEKLITLARRGDLHARRLVERRIRDKEISGRLFKEIRPRFAAPPRGDTPVLPLGAPPGEGAHAPPGERPKGKPDAGTH